MTAFDALGVSCSTFNSSYSIWLSNQNITQKIINEKKSFMIIFCRCLFIYSDNILVIKDFIDLHMKNKVNIETLKGLLQN
jgi:hypothetical protein